MWWGCACHLLCLLGEVYVAGEKDYSPDLLAQGIEEEPGMTEWREAALQVWEEDTQWMHIWRASLRTVEGETIDNGVGTCGGKVEETSGEWEEGGMVGDRTDGHQKTLEQMGEKLYDQEVEGLEECLSSLEFEEIVTPEERTEVTSFIRESCPGVLSLNKFDLGEYTGPPLNIETEEGKEVRQQEMKMEPRKMEVGDKFVEQMMSTGIIVKAQPSAGHYIASWSQKTRALPAQTA